MVKCLFFSSSNDIFQLRHPQDLSRFKSSNKHLNEKLNAKTLKVLARAVNYSTDTELKSL